MDAPKISIVTINRNNKAGLEKTCRSVVSQTVKPYEWIIIDGDSTDGSVDVIKQYAEYISYWVSEADNGIYNAMNKGVDRVTGDYVQFLNSGDSLASVSVVSEVQTFLTNRNCDYMVGRVMLDGVKEHQIVPPNDVSGSFLFQSYLSHPAAFVRSSLIKCIHFDEDFKISSDWIFSVKALLLTNAKYQSSDILVADYDTNGVSMTHNWDAVAEKEKAWKMIFGERVYEDYVRLTSGKTILEKIVCRIAKYKELYTLLTILALPVFALYKIRKHF